MILDSEESKNVAVVHKTNQGFSGKDLYKLKMERPELFGNAGGAVEAAAASGIKIPQGFMRVNDVPGWVYNPAVGVYMNKENGKFFCRDATTGSFYDLHKGEDISSALAVRGDAAACAKTGGAASRNVVINDIRKAASAMKLDLAHLDSPAAMFAVYDGRPLAGGAGQAEQAAKGLHVKLLPRLAQYRGKWDVSMLEKALAESIALLAKEIGAEETGVSLAVGLLVGRQLILAASRTGMCMVLDPEDADAGEDHNLTATESQPPVTHCIDLAQHETHLGVLLTVDATKAAGVSSGRIDTMVRPHLIADRVKAGCVAFLAEAQKGGVEPPLVVAGIRIAWTQQVDSTAKRAKVAGPTKVRCRHILLRHAASTIATGERVKKKPTRTAGEAEAQMLDVFLQITRGDAAAFTAQCRSSSECDTALRGGDLAGDLGWLDKDPAKNRKVPATVVRAAFTLAVGQLSDIVASERGVHLVLRTG